MEVPAGKPTSCFPGDGMYLHVSQAALGESKDKSGKGNARVVLKVQVDDSDVVLGTLSEGKCDQMPLDLVFDREFTVSHNSNSSSVYICGYRTEGPEYDSEDEDDEDEVDVPEAVPIASNGAAAGKQVKAVKVEDVAKKVAEKAQTLTNAVLKDQKKAAKKQVVSSSSDEEEDSDDEDEGLGHPFVSDLASESDDEFDAGDDSDEDMDEDDDEDDDDEDDEDESDESEEEELKIEAPKPGKKRAAEELTKSTEKKSKTDASSKLGQYPGKKGGKGAPVTKATAPAELKTPTDKGSKPAKAPKGTPAAPPTTPVSEKKIGQHKCTGCDRTFVTESAMSQHAAAKHGPKA